MVKIVFEFEHSISVIICTVFVFGYHSWTSKIQIWSISLFDTSFTIHIRIRFESSAQERKKFVSVLVVSIWIRLVFTATCGVHWVPPWPHGSDPVASRCAPNRCQSCRWIRSTSLVRSDLIVSCLNGLRVARIRTLAIAPRWIYAGVASMQESHWGPHQPKKRARRRRGARKGQIGMGLK
jgi:hypothetical protein